MILLLFVCWSLTSLARGTMHVVDRLIPRPDAVLAEVPVTSHR